MIKLADLFLEIKLNEVSIQQLEDNFVKTGKISRENFAEILKVTKNDSALATWMVAKVAGSKKNPSIIKPEDIYKYEKYLDVYNRRKKEYRIKDINLIKTLPQLQDFIKTSVELLDQEEQDPSAQKGISKQEKFKDLKIADDLEGFTVYMIPKGREDLYPTSCELGSGTEWCTAAGNYGGHFKGYIKQGPLFIFIDNKNPKNKYQAHFESKQFMNKNDNPIYELMPY